MTDYAEEHGFLGTDPIASARAERSDTVVRVTSGGECVSGPRSAVGCVREFCEHCALVDTLFARSAGAEQVEDFG